MKPAVAATIACLLSACSPAYADNSPPLSVMGTWKTAIVPTAIAPDYRAKEWEPEGYQQWKQGYLRGKAECEQQKEGRHIGK